MYHSIAATQADPWCITVTPQNFADHLKVLQQFGKPISLTDFAHGMARGELPQRAIALTFDDGYANNLEVAKPLLEQYDIPATVFVASGYLDQNREFWWDELAQLLLTPGLLPAQLALEVNGHTQKWHLGAAQTYTEAMAQQDSCCLVESAEPGSRLALYGQLWQALLHLPFAMRQQTLDALWVWADRSPQVRSAYRPLRSDELLPLEQSGHVSVGGHTVTHSMLSRLSTEEQFQEIYQCKVDLEVKLGHVIHSFAYPFGNYSPTTVPCVAEAGFSHACSTIVDTAWSRYDAYQLPRFEAQNWSGPELVRRLRRLFW
ncbi:polysaccharide deacetylase family protein [Synechococcales cyanobacterium C]|uniref:Polysaccharide deacetylase family protein n=1 Tax=Petrachloros mirabilis ULC683 TaxID=2781853 RepID=A0A8K2A009_9CYAN|nr:polysaccharide deacetylase family protein [Petrachloros mirabilis]NCJ08460.1 polysaccharide deacetylase family protein [Petrachloros mirabilis ULC683]